MAEETKGQASSAGADKTASENWLNKLVDTLTEKPFKWTMLLLILIIGIQSQQGKKLLAEFLDYAGEKKKDFEEWWEKVSPTVGKLLGKIRTVFLWYIVILLILLLGILNAVWSKDVGGFFLFAAATWSIIFLLIFTFGARKQNKAEKLTDKLLVSFYYFMIRVNTIAFLIIATIFLNVYSPTNLMPTWLKFGLMTFIVLTAMYGIIANIKFQFGLVIILIICGLLTFSQIIFSQSQINNWLIERSANTDLTQIITTDIVYTYDPWGRPIEKISKETVMYVNFSDFRHIKGGGKAFLCFLDRPGGTPKYIYLKKGINYHYYKP